MNIRRTTAALSLILLAGACGDSSDAINISAQNEPDAGSVSQYVPVNVTEFDGLSKDEAIAKAEAESREWRIGSEDGEFFALTEDFHPGRVTLDIVEGEVSSSFIEMEQPGSEMVVEPQNSDEPSPDAGAPSEFVTALIGMSKDEAITSIEAAGQVWRVSSEDGEDFILTMDYSEDRVTLAIVDGIVVDAVVG